MPMKWDEQVIFMAPKDVILEGLVELLSRAGFTEQSREYKRKGGLELVVLRGVRENPFTGRDVMSVALLSGRADEKALEELLPVIKDSGVVVNLIPGLVLSEGRAIGPKELAEVFNRYSIKPPVSLVEKLLPDVVEGEEEGLKEFVLDGPLLEEVKHGELLERVKRVLGYRYKIPGERVHLEKLTIKLRPLYVISWTLGDGKVRRSLVDGEKVRLNAEIGRLKGLTMRILLEEDGKVLASGLEVEGPGAKGAEALLREELGKKYDDVRILETKRAYVPVEAFIEFSAGRNRGSARIRLPKGAPSVSLKKLEEPILREIVLEHVKGVTGEKPLSLTVKNDKRRLLREFIGKTERYLFDVAVNSYSGEVVASTISLTEEAVLAIVHSRYPGAKVIGVERRRGVTLVDLLADGSLYVVRVNSLTGEVEDVKALYHPKEILEEGLREHDGVVTPGSLDLAECQVKNHEIVRAVFRGGDGIVEFTYNGHSGEIIEWKLEISQDKALELVSSAYPEFKPVFTGEFGDHYMMTLESEDRILKLRVFKDGRMEKLDEFLREAAVERRALEYLREIEPKPVIESLKLEENWVVEFTGTKWTGTLVLHRSSGELLNRELNLTEKFMVKSFLGMIAEEYGDSAKVEVVSHHVEEGIAGLKAVGEKGYYFAKIDVRSGEIIARDFVPKGLKSKLKLSQVEGRYVR